MTAALVAHLSWRWTYLVLAAVLAAVTIPLHALALRHPWPPAAHHRVDHPTGRPVTTARTRPFLLLATAFMLSGFAMYGVVFNLIPLLTHRGASSTVAAWALGLGGLGQTLGRTLYATLARRTGGTGRTVTLVAAGGVTTALLALVPGPVRWGTTSYGHLSALLAAPPTIAGALAPWATASLAHAIGGYPALFLLLATVSVTAAAISAAADGIGRDSPA